MGVLAMLAGKGECLYCGKIFTLGRLRKFCSRTCRLNEKSRRVYARRTERGEKKLGGWKRDANE